MDRRILLSRAAASFAAAVALPLLPAAQALEPARAGPALGAMVAFDASYIPALAATSAAAQNPQGAAAAREATRALQAEWPGLRQALAAAFGAGARPPWPVALEHTGRRIEAAVRAVERADWSGAHEELEEVRVELMDARRAQGMDYFVDRLTACHEPMEVLALAGATLKPEQLTGDKRAELARAYAQVAALWSGIERFPVAADDYALDARRKSQFDEGVRQERAALEALGRALQGSDDARLLQAAAAVKPPFARVFTAFGQPASQRQR